MKVTKPKLLHKDKRGKIINLGEDDFASALLITSKKGAIRANHYHRWDTHLVYMVDGKMRYWYRNRKKGARKRSVIVKKGELIFTPTMQDHAMEFLQDSTFLAMTSRTRKQKSYEDDIVRVKLI